MKRLLLLVLIALGIIVIVGCAQRKAVQAPEQPAAPSAPKAEEKAAPQKEIVTEKPVAPSVQAETKPGEKELETKVEDILFDFDKSDIRNDAKPILKNLSSILSTNTKAMVTIEGNCDERGTSEYNVALGDRRANAAKSYLVSLGIPSGRIRTISYGKEKPVCAESTEECWAKNRRDHFVLTEASR